jgi:hypothetical protein
MVWVLVQLDSKPDDKKLEEWYSWVPSVIVCLWNATAGSPNSVDGLGHGKAGFPSSTDGLGECYSWVFKFC